MKNKKVIAIPEGKTIMVVDDVDINHYIIIDMLEEFKLNILYARSGLEAIQALKNNPMVELILMDIKMPVMNGYKATAEIKKIKPDIIIVAQTAYTLVSDKNQAINAGCDDYIAKPIDKNVLVNILSKYLK